MPDAGGLAHLPTPLEVAPRLGTVLGARLLVKRDDLTGLALGGNKARKLQRLVADAVALGSDVLVTGGGIQSNHARLTAAAAAATGLGCHLVLAGPDAKPSGNLLLDRVLGATIEVVDAPGYYDVEAAIEAAGARLRADGRKPYVIPVGGASAPGVRAYADAAHEVVTQATALGVTIDWIVVADGSGGTHAGLLAGLPPGVRVLGIDVGTRPDLDTAVPRLASEVSGGDHIAAAVRIDHDHAGPSYGSPTADAVAAIRSAARTEGLLLDPVYTGKALAALTTWLSDGRIRSEETVVFWHTGGAPAMFAEPYQTLLGS